MVTPEMNIAPTEETTYCEVHPDRETGLRCNKCGRYMCVDCAVRTPVGYRCKECVRGIEDKFFNASQYDYIIIAGVCGGLAAVAAGLVQAINIWLLFVIIIGFPAGGAIAEAALRMIQRRRGRHSAQIAVAATAVGGLIGGVLSVYIRISNAYSQAAAQLPAQARADIPPISLDVIFGVVMRDLSLLIFIGVIAFAVYGRFKMRM